MKRFANFFDDLFIAIPISWKILEKKTRTRSCVFSPRKNRFKIPHFLIFSNLSQDMKSLANFFEDLSISASVTCILAPLMCHVLVSGNECGYQRVCIVWSFLLFFSTASLCSFVLKLQNFGSSEVSWPLSKPLKYEKKWLPKMFHHFIPTPNKNLASGSQTTQFFSASFFSPIDIIGMSSSISVFQRLFQVSVTGSWEDIFSGAKI